MARPERFELPTFWFVARHSIQLSYGRAENEKRLQALENQLYAPPGRSATRAARPALGPDSGARIKASLPGARN